MTPGELFGMLNLLGEIFSFGEMRRLSWNILDANQLDGDLGADLR